MKFRNQGAMITYHELLFRKQDLVPKIGNKLISAKASVFTNTAQQTNVNKSCKFYLNK